MSGRRRLVALVPLCITLLAGPALAQCRQALVLALDVSGSVDSREYRLQLDGLAAALKDPAVQKALLAQPANPVQLAVFEWSGPSYQRLLLGWTAITGPDVLLKTSAYLAALPRRNAPPGTALGNAMQYGADMLATGPDCRKRTLDISGDGKGNLGLRPRDVRQTLVRRDLTVNALVIGADAPVGGDIRQVELGELSAYFRARVITGPGAFVETAIGFEAYRAAMIRKLLRELETLAVSSLFPGGDFRPGRDLPGRSPPALRRQ